MSEPADSLARALYRCTEFEIANHKLRKENEKMRAALKLCDEAMSWCLGGEPIDTLMIEARLAARAALQDGDNGSE